jgi:hypothetical protein
VAFGVPPGKREQVRDLLIDQHGEALELIAPIGAKRPTMKHARAGSPSENRKR